MSHTNAQWPHQVRTNEFQHVFCFKLLIYTEGKIQHGAWQLIAFLKFWLPTIIKTSYSGYKYYTFWILVQSALLSFAFLHSTAFFPFLKSKLFHGLTGAKTMEGEPLINKIHQKVSEAADLLPIGPQTTPVFNDHTLIHLPTENTLNIKWWYQPCFPHTSQRQPRNNNKKTTIE